MQHCKIAMAACLLLSVGCATVRAQSPALFVIPTETPNADVLSDGQEVSIRVFARDLPKLARILGITDPKLGEDSIVYRLGPYPQLPNPTGASKLSDWLRPSFVVDFDEPPVVELSKKFVEKEGAHPDSAKVIQYVANLVEGKSGHGFDIASRVARDREGDCTEYAVLLAALARSVGIPARIVMGMAVVREATQYQAYGHAWAEFLIDNRWQVADAALSKSQKLFFYLPFGVLDDEGPGFTFAIARLTPVWVQRVIVFSEPPPGHTSRH